MHILESEVSMSISSSKTNNNIVHVTAAGFTTFVLLSKMESWSIYCGFFLQELTRKINVEVKTNFYKVTSK